MLAANSGYFPSYGGGNKSDRLLMRALARRGHTCRVAVRAVDTMSRDHTQYFESLRERGVSYWVPMDGMVSFNLDGVEVCAATTANIRTIVLAQIREFRPDVVIVSNDPLNVLIMDLPLTKGIRIVYLARATTVLPFGPESVFPSKAKTNAIRRANAVVAVSQYLADYVVEHSGIPAIYRPIQLFDTLDWPCLGSFENSFITMVNPCALKGIVIFLALADSFPNAQFAVVPTWGTNAEDRTQLAARPNIRFLEPVDDIREILQQTRVTLVPSLWAEARSRMIFESMISGIPVLASDRGGNREAMMNVPGLLPVQPIVGYEKRMDDQLMRVAKVPPQDIMPWCDALGRLISDHSHYDEISSRQRAAALEFVGNLDIELFESILQPSPTSVS
ncbi:MAG TPA: glycosyltransferase family 4 protein [Acidobacteriaceae bacterium]|nr:glycosyltransferase family 4 protein [Acidobacteriaceae bacterium]